MLALYGHWLPQLRSSIWTLTSVALLFMVPRSTLGSAISKTEREIERSGDGRGRPAVLTNRQVPACLHAVKGSTKGTNVDRCDTLRCTVLILAALSVVRLSTIDYRRRKKLTGEIESVSIWI